jgi:hypothetical protein
MINECDGGGQCSCWQGLEWQRSAAVDQHQAASVAQITGQLDN